jgi:hypothetical protein
MSANRRVARVSAWRSFVVAAALPAAFAVALSVMPPACAQQPEPPSPPAAASAPVSSSTSVVPAGSTKPLPAVPSAKPTEEKSGFLGIGKKKEEYTGPTEVVALAPTPMLDEEGKQRVDADGNLMFNKPVLQQRDKHGHPLFDEKGKPVFQTASDLGYDKDGHKLHAQKEKPPKMTPVTISRGVLTVDGMTGEAALNYQIADLHYIYIYAPTIGIAVVSDTPFPGAIEQKDAFDDKLLTISVEGHELQLASDQRLMGKKPVDAYVLLDREFRLPSRHPVLGYGDIRRAPYAWPGSKANTQLSAAAFAPPPPANLMPVQLLGPCPKGEMRMPAKTALPGQPIPPQPCVTIAQAQSARAALQKKTAQQGASSAAAAPSATLPVVKND